MARLDSCPILFNPTAQGIIAKNNAEKKAAFGLINFLTKKYKTTTEKTPAKADTNLTENSFNPNILMGISNEYLLIGG